MINDIEKKIVQAKILKSRLALHFAKYQLIFSRLNRHHDYQKNWDFYHASKVSNLFVRKTTKILDAGAGISAHFAQLAVKQGFRHVYSIDFLPLKNKIARKYPQIIHQVANLEETPFENNFFDVVACLSVIEHVANDQKVLEELYRITKPGGVLIISTDYWPSGINTAGLFPYGEENPEARVYSDEDIYRYLIQAKEMGWEIPSLEFLNGKVRKPIVTWERMGLKYTFTFFVLRKSMDQK